VITAAARVLDALDEALPALYDGAAALVAVPSVSGTAGENEVQQLLADRLRRTGYDVDHWAIDLDELTVRPDFPGVEVERQEAWGLVGRVPGSGDGPTLMLNGHVDVVPIGEPRSVAGPAVRCGAT
jgi:acetylornithine deacetylase